VWWHEQSWPKIEALDKNLPVVISLGSIEQHGKHLPLCVDTVQVTTIAERAEKILGDRAIFVPTLWLGSSDHHKDFPGTITVAPSLYSEMIMQLSRSILRAGFWRIFFLNGHGGNETPGAQALTELVAEDDQADAGYLVFSSWWQLAKDAIAPQKHDMATAGVSHACEYETSLMLAIRPELVETELASDTTPVLAGPWFTVAGGGKVRMFRRFHRLTATGSLGQPTAATSAKGAAMLDAIVEDVVAFVRDFATWPDLPPRKSS